jgi:hypothetical protein
MSDSVIAALKEKQKETLIAQREQALAQLGQSAASRGMGDSAWVGAQQANLSDAFGGDVTNAYRTIDTNAVTQNRQDLLNALGAVQSALGTQNQANSVANTYNLGQQTLAEKAGEFSQEMPLNWFSALSNALLGNYNYGLGLSQLEQNSQNNMLSSVMKALGLG